MKQLRKHAQMLKVLSSAKPNLQKAIINGAEKPLIETLCDCANNILKGYVSLSTNQKSRLRRHKQSLRSLTKIRCLKRKKKILQSGGFLGSLLAPILGVLGTIFSG